MDISIGQLARLTGLPVKTVRYYSDIGVAPAAGRSPGGYRRFDEAGLARLELVRGRRPCRRHRPAHPPAHPAPCGAAGHRPPRLPA